MEGINTEEVSFELGLEYAWDLVSGRGVSTSRSQESRVCLGHKKQLSKAEAVVQGICSFLPNLAYREQSVYLHTKKQSSIWTVAFFINQNQSLLMHDGPSMLHRALFSVF